MKFILTLACLLACSGDDGDACIFDGRYDFGVDWSDGNYRPECGLFVASFDFEQYEMPCYDVGRDVTSTGELLDTAITCGSGNPVVECTGYAFRNDGCRWPVYIRRIVP